MQQLNRKELNGIAKLSLSFLWIFTGLTSIFFSPELGYKILANADINGTLADIALIGGGTLNIMLGVWLLTSFRIKLCCALQVTVIAIYTLLLTIIDPSYWLHPFGPVTKNLPIIVLIIYLYNSKADEI